MGAGLQGLHDHAAPEGRILVQTSRSLLSARCRYRHGITHPLIATYKLLVLYVSENQVEREFQRKKAPVTPAGAFLCWNALCSNFVRCQIPAANGATADAARDFLLGIFPLYLGELQADMLS